MIICGPAVILIKKYRYGRSLQMREYYLCLQQIYQTTGGILSYRHLPLSICWSFQICLWNLLLQMSQTNGRVWKHLMLFLCLLRLQLFLNKTIWTWKGRDTDKLVFRVGHIHLIKLLCDNVSIKRNEFTFVFFQSSL